MVSYSKTVQDNNFEIVSMDFIVDMMKHDKSLKNKIEAIRRISDTQLRQEKKKELLPIFNPGIFKGNIRKNENLMSIEFLTFDFDHLKEDEYQKVLTKLKKDPRTFLIFRSPSGGLRLKVLFRLDSPLCSQRAYEAVYLYYHKKFSQELGTEIDIGNKNSQLGSFLSYDPDLFYNPHCRKLSTRIDFQETFETDNIPDHGEYHDLNNLSGAVQFLKRKIVGYSEYCTVMYSLASIGEKGREHFITICSDNPSYPKDSPEHLSLEFDKALRSYNPYRPNRIRINSLFYLAKKKGYKFPRKSFDYTEMGLSERIVYWFGNEIRYCNELRRWFIWNKKKWAEDKTGSINDYYRRMIEKLREEMREIKDPERQKALKQHIKIARSRRTCENVLHLLETETKVRITAEEMDSRGDLFNCDNRIIELCSGKVGVAKHSPEFLITKQSKASLDPDAECPKWMEFLNTTFNGNDSLISFIQRVVGYCLTSETSEEVLFFLYGAGANGKTVFIETLSLLFGEYYRKTPIETFLNFDKQAGQASPELVMLKGARLVVGSEVPDNKSLNDKLIKDLTGGDAIAPRPLYGEFITFKPVCKVILYGNHRPVIKSADYGIKRRLLLIPFEHVIPPEERKDKSDMLAEFERELPGILNWAIEGYINWYHFRLSPPPQIKEATNGYFTDNDLLQSFINERCNISTVDNVVAQDFYSVYSEYLKEKGEYPPSAKRVYEKLREKGYMIKKGTANKGYIWGLNLLAETDYQLE